jgi:Asp-tRNA(Asn)/Glu-tRNA(Gln) amidotransferase B subunit
MVTTGRDPKYGALVDKGVAPRIAFNHVMNEEIPEDFNAAELARVLNGEGLTRAAVQAAIAASATPGFSADEYLAQTAVSDTGELDPVIDAVLAANPGQVAAYQGGKEGLLGFFVGQVMKETNGKASPKVVNDLLREKLKA